MPDPDEMDAAFDGPPDDEDASENHGLLGNAPPGSAEAPGRIPGDYDFERDYVSSCVAHGPNQSLMDRPCPLPHLPPFSHTHPIILHQATPTV